MPLLLSHPTYPASPTARDDDGNTPLHHASAAGSLKALRILLSAGADPSTTNAQDWSPLAYSQTVAAEVYFKNLIAEFARARMDGQQQSQQHVQDEVDADRGVTFDGHVSTTGVPQTRSGTQGPESPRPYASPSIPSSPAQSSGSLPGRSAMAPPPSRRKGGAVRLITDDGGAGSDRSGTATPNFGDGGVMTPNTNGSLGLAVGARSPVQIQGQSQGQPQGQGHVQQGRRGNMTPTSTWATGGSWGGGANYDGVRPRAGSGD